MTAEQAKYVKRNKIVTVLIINDTSVTEDLYYYVSLNKLIFDSSLTGLDAADKVCTTKRRWSLRMSGLISSANQYIH
jgi:hypothetical protein